MTTIELFHLRRVRDKPRAAALLAAHASLTAEAALAAVHQAVGGGKPQITVADEDAARRLIAALAGTGFIARRAAAGDFDAAQHASHALEAVLPHFAPGAADEPALRCWPVTGPRRSRSPCSTCRCTARPTMLTACCWNTRPSTPAWCAACRGGCEPAGFNELKGQTTCVYRP